MNYAGAANAPVRVQGNEVSLRSLDKINDEMSGAVNRVHNAIDRVRSFVDEMQGPRPSGGIGKDQPERAGRLGTLQDRVDQLHASLSTLEGELDRLVSI